MTLRLIHNRKKRITLQNSSRNVFVKTKVTIASHCNRSIIRKTDQAHPASLALLVRLFSNSPNHSPSRRQKSLPVANAFSRLLPHPLVFKTCANQRLHLKLQSHQHRFRDFLGSNHLPTRILEPQFRDSKNGPN